MSKTTTIPAAWTPDCQGKWDFDGKLVSLSTRYWPSGGGVTILRGGKLTEGIPGVRPSAHATIYLGSTEDEFYDDAVKLVEREFEGDAEAEVKSAVEAWACEQWERIRKALLAEFQVAK